MKRILLLLLVLLLGLSLAGCKDNNDTVIYLNDPPSNSGSDADSGTADKIPDTSPDNNIPDDDSGVSDTSGDTAEDLPQDTAEDEPDLQEVTLYFSDDAGTNFISFPVPVAKGDFNGIIYALSDMGVLDSSVKITTFTSLEDGGKSYVKLDLNSAFASQVAASGQGNGYMLIGSVVNTFLEACGADGVMLTSGGKALTADGVTYNGYLTAFGTNLNPPQLLPEDETFDEDEGENIPADDNPIVATALSLLGAPYEYGSSGPDTFDNSGFVYYCFKANDITIPRRTSAMFLEGDAVNKKDLQKGDVVFFSFEGSTTNPTYAAIYIGDGKAIAESNESSPVSIFSINISYYSDSYVGARRYS